MASGPHTFVIVGVFSAESFQGNRLAIVAVRGNVITRDQKALIAKEFGYTGTVFIHDAVDAGLPRRVEIFTGSGEELSFSGHCVLGTAHYVFQYCEPTVAGDDNKPLTTVLMTKAGPVPVLYNPHRHIAACSIPQSFHLHEKKVHFSKVQIAQPQIQIVPTMEKCKDKTFPVVSIVQGMTFSLIDLTDAPEVLAALTVNPSPDVELDEGWDPAYIGALYYRKKGSLVQAGEPTIHSIQARVISKGIEDPGTGSACSALACYLALNEKDSSSPDQKPAEPTTETETETATATAEKTAHSTPDAAPPRTVRHIYAIQQGIEMGRRCTIALEIDINVAADGKKHIKNVTLSGRASFFARGELTRLP